MKKTDDVFFFVLIDFLLQVFFFGLLLYSFSNTLKADEDKQMIRILDGAGISNLTELNDLLTTMQAVKSALAKNGDIQKVVETCNFVSDNGGLNKLKTIVAKAKEGTGKPPCIYTLGSDNIKNPKFLATVIATDTTIAFESPTPDLLSVLQQLDLTYDSVKSLSLPDFKRKFSAITSVCPDCRYTLRFKMNTNLNAPREAAESAFYLKIEK